MQTSDLIPIAEAAKRLPGRPHVSTLHRWSQRGCKGVKLQITRVGSRIFTTEEALQRFIDQCSESDGDRLESEGC